jgi:hypothetical protein
MMGMTSGGGSKTQHRNSSAKGTAAPKRGVLTPAGRRKLSELMKARWAAKRKAEGKKSGKKK